MVTEDQVAAAAMARVTAALGNRVLAYDHDQVPVDRPAEFVVVTVVRRAGGPARAGRSSVTGWAVYVMAASQTSVDNARLSLQKVNAEVENKTLAVGTDPVETSTPITFATAKPVAPDKGWFTGVTQYHFAI